MAWETVQSAALVVHILAGGVGLVLAGPVLVVRKGRGAHARLGRVYVGALVIMAVTALLLVAADPVRLAALGVVAVATLGWGLGGAWVARRRPRLPGGWRVWHLNLMGSSVIAFVTAFAVTALDGGLVAWVLPTLLGSPLIAHRTLRAARRTAPPPGASMRAPTLGQP
jgi:hypothetical protein